MGLGARLAIVVAGVAMATALLVGGASYVTTDRQVAAELDDFLKGRADEIADGQRQQPSDRGQDRDGRGDDDRPPIAVSPDAEVQILDKDGSVLTNSGLILPVDSADKELADSNGPARYRTVSIDGADYRMITDHLSEGGAVQVARSLEESTGLVDVLQTRILAIAGVLAVVAGAVGWVVAQRTTRPLRALTDAVDKVAITRDFSVPVPASGRDEVGRLASGFNRMLGALQQSQEQQRRLIQDSAHELRTPLTSITANVEWLMRAPDLDGDAREDALQSIRSELGELNNVMAEIIELATDSHEPPTLEATDLEALVIDAVGQFRRRSDRDVLLEASPVMVMGDADSLTRAIANLMSNAEKYSPTGTAIAVEVGPDGVFVDDSGPGIPGDEQQLVFERFYRRDEDRSKPGSGLGLSIVAGIVDQHGGTTVATDSARGGARVGFRLPARRSTWD